jgi:C4-dicarboxylate transporter
MSGKEILVGSLIVLVAALMFFFLSRWVTDMLVRKRKSPSAASRAGWALFFFLTFTTALLVFGGIGHLWASWMFLAPMAVLVIGSLIMCIVSVVSAR